MPPAYVKAYVKRGKTDAADAAAIAEAVQRLTMIAKMCRFSLPPGYTRTKPVEKPKLGPPMPMIEAILEVDRTEAAHS